MRGLIADEEGVLRYDTAMRGEIARLIDERASRGPFLSMPDFLERSGVHDHDEVSKRNPRVFLLALPQPSKVHDGKELRARSAKPLVASPLGLGVAGADVEVDGVRAAELMPRAEAVVAHAEEHDCLGRTVCHSRASR